MSSNPSVATKTVFAPSPSSSAFVAAVVPWANSSTSFASAEARSSTAVTAFSTPSDWSSGVVGAFAVTQAAADGQHRVREGPAHVHAQEHRAWTLAQAASSTSSSVSARC